jgi:hypothetical protein
MPLVRIDAIEGRTEEQVRAVLDAVHRAVVSAFGVPLRDRYQIYSAHAPAHFIVEDTGLGIARGPNVLVVSVTSRPRTIEQKQALYQALCRELEIGCGIAPADVMVNIVTNTDSDWSFGLGRAQFLTGEL